MAEGYDPTADYSSAYDALKKRIAQSYAGQRSALNQELATRGVQTSGVSSIPSSRLGAAQAGEEAGIAGQFALEQARTRIADRQSAEQFSRDKQLAELGYGQQSALQRRMAQSGLESSLISGGLGAVGGALAGPIGYAGTAALTPVINRYTSGELRGNYGQKFRPY